MQNRDYVLGTHDAELERLGLQHRLWSGVALECWERAGVASGSTVADIGCGPGYASFDLASLVTDRGRVIAIDESTRFIDYLRVEASRRGTENIDALRADVHHPGIPAATVDVAFARWVLCFVRDPESVVREVARCLRPGGRFAVQDYVHYEAILFAPPDDVFRRVIRAVADSWRRRGGDPDVCQRVPSMMQRHGLAVEHIRPIVRSARPDSPLWLWPSSFFKNYLPMLVQQGLLSEDDMAKFEREWEARSSDPGAFFCSPPMLEVIGRKKP